MQQERGFWPSFTFSLIRLSPVVAPAVIVPAIPQDPLAAELFFKQVLSLLAVLITWNMTEGGAILWIKAKNEANDKTRSYLLVTMICAMISIGFLQYLRTLTSQGTFILTLGALSLRGMARSGWENRRPAAGYAGAIVGNLLITLVSFLFIAPALDWQSAVCAFAVGFSISSVEASWHSESFSTESNRWALPLFRLSLCTGPVMIATMGMSNQLPQTYLLSVLVILAASRVLKKTKTTPAIPADFACGAAGIYIAFLTIMGIARAL